MYNLEDQKVVHGSEVNFHKVALVQSSPVYFNTYSQYAEILIYSEIPKYLIDGIKTPIFNLQRIRLHFVDPPQEWSAGNIYKVNKINE